EPADIPGFGSLDKALVAEGFSAGLTRGDATAWGGRRADQWVTKEYLDILTKEFESYSSFDVLFLCIGGNDLLRAAQERNLGEMSEGEMRTLIEAITRDVATILDHCHAQRPKLRAVIYGYAYLDLDAAVRAYKMGFHGLSSTRFNEVLYELEKAKKGVAKGRPWCAMEVNIAALQGDDGPPGDPALGMPAEMHVGDGVHPNATGHEKMCVATAKHYIGPWLRGASK
ncbi:MAG: SGNH/GDSL hydrolase family protein, partial [Candidatus Hydrogenedentota bacterium]